MRDVTATPGDLLTLRPLRVDDEAEALQAHAELAADGFHFLHGHDQEPWPEFVARLERQNRGIEVPAGFVRTTFLVADVGGRIVGRTSIRHELDEALRAWGGHIGYGVRPAFRRRGHATAILAASLRLAAGFGIDRALVSCDIDNVASARVIERCGGVLEDVVAADPEPPKRRYWVPTAPFTGRRSPLTGRRAQDRRGPGRP